MEGATNNVQNQQGSNQEDAQPTSPPVELSREEQIQSLTQLLENLFDPNNLVNNLYLIQKAQNNNFEIPIKFVYMERSVKGITTDRDTINEALNNASNVVVLKKDGYVTAVKPKQNELQRKVDVKNIPLEKKDSFKAYVYSIEEIKDSIINLKFNPQIKITSIICKDEASASLLFEKLTSNQFEEETLDCALSTESLYISAIENQNRKSRGLNNNLPINPYGMNPQMNPMYGYNPYGGYNPYQMSGYYGMPQNNFYVTKDNYSNMNHYYNNPAGGQGYAKTGYNGNASGYKKPYNPNYKSGDKKPHLKRGGKQPRDNKNFKYNNKGAKSSNIEVNETEFPPL